MELERPPKNVDLDLELSVKAMPSHSFRMQFSNAVFEWLLENDLGSMTSGHPLSSPMHSNL